MIVEELDEFINSHDVVQTYQFLIYGVPTEEEISLLARGLFFQFQDNPEEKAIVVAQHIDEETAVALNQYRGVVLTFAFASRKKKEPLIRTIVLDGIEYLRYKAEYLGTRECASNV